MKTFYLLDFDNIGNAVADRYRSKYSVGHEVPRTPKATEDILIADNSVVYCWGGSDWYRTAAT